MKAPIGSYYLFGFKGTISRGKEILQFEGSFKKVKDIYQADCDVLYGKATLLYEDGSKQYEGEFRDDQFAGNGTYYYKDGSKYVGFFRNNMYDGLGTEFSPDGTKLQEGLWKAGEFVKEQAIPQLKERKN